MNPRWFGRVQRTTTAPHAACPRSTWLEIRASIPAPHITVPRPSQRPSAWIPRKINEIVPQLGLWCLSRYFIQVLYGLTCRLPNGLNQGQLEFGQVQIEFSLAQLIAYAK